MAFHSHPTLASAFSGSILHRQLAAAPPATSTAAHIRLSGCGHALKPSPSIDSLFFMSVFKSYVAGPHRPLRQQPISGFPDVGMLQIAPNNPPRLSILTRRAEGARGDEKQAACFCLLSFLQKMLCDNIRVGSWLVMAQLITLLSFRG
jgi:hypothetical protein